MADLPNGRGKLALHIHLLGGLQVSLGEGIVEAGAWKLRKAKSLLKLLALAAGHRLHREQVMELLWPELEPEYAANNLHQALFAARRALASAAGVGQDSPQEIIRIEESALLLDPPGGLWIDAEAFQQAAAQARRSQDPDAYRAALELYTGELLPEDRYEDWASARRAALESEHSALLLDLARLYAGRGEISAALPLYRQVLGTDPAHEEAVRGLMSLYARAGQRQEALRQYAAFEETLRRELDAAPEPDTVRLYEEIRSGHLTLPEAPTPTTGAATPTRLYNLPSPLSTFIGREAEIEQVRVLLEHARLVTLTGPGGVGKTRLSIQAGSEVLEAYPGGVWFVELAPLADPALVAQPVLVALGLQAEGERAPGQVLVDYFREKTALLILDNCEHLVEAAARLCESLLRACPRLHILASSRETLGISGESAYQVSPLFFPASRKPDPQEVLESDAGRLFAERAAAVRPGFAVTPANAASIAQICRRLDGIPLAIELAAVRIHLLGVEQIAARLDDRFRLLTGGSRTALPRHRTLRAAIDWSWELLSGAERALARRLSAFAGGWPLEAAEAICTDEAQTTADRKPEHEIDLPVHPSEVLDLMASLAKKSLILVAQDEAGEARYYMLETIRQYAGEKLLEAGESGLVRNRLRDWFLALAERAEPELKSHRQIAWANRLELEHDNLRLALEWSIGQKEAVPALRLANALSYFWLIHGYFEEGIHWLQEALALAGEGSPLQRSALRARACLGLSHLRINSGGDAQAQPQVEEALAISRELGDRDGIGYALYLKAGSLLNIGSDDLSRADLIQESLQHWHAVENRWGVGAANQVLVEFGLMDRQILHHAIEESENLLRQVGDRYVLSYTLATAGWFHWKQGDPAKAHGLFLESLEITNEIRSKTRIAQALQNLSIFDRWQGDFAAALALNQESLGILRELGINSDIPYAQLLLAELDHLQGNLAAARQGYAECLKAVPEDTGGFRTGACLEKLADLAYREGDFQTAKVYLDKSLAVLGQLEERYFPLLVFGDIARAEGEYAKAAPYYHQSLEVMRLNSYPMFSPRLFEALAKLSAALGRMEEAARLLGMAHSARQAYGTPLPPLERPEYDRVLSEMQSALGAGVFTTAWQAGAGLPKDAWIEAALEMARELEMAS